MMSKPCHTNSTLRLWTIAVWSPRSGASAGNIWTKRNAGGVTDSNIPTSLSREVSLSLFRVVQEAVHNSIKYSGESHCKVHLERKAEEIELEISDRGAGFDWDGMEKGKGLGLVSMSERIHLVNGRITIDSKPNVGTTIRACVPLAAHTSGSLVMSAQQERAV